jgi:fatty-acyl-CoA synthase
VDHAATLPALLDAVAACHAGREAVVSARERLMYADLARRSRDAGRAFAARGVGKGTRVGLLLPNRAEWLVLAAGVWRCGGVVVPLSTLGRPRELAHALRHADVQLLVGVRRFLRHDYGAALAEIAPACSPGGAPRYDGALPALRDVVWLEPPPDGVAADLGPLAAAAPAAPWPDPLTAEVSPADAATIVFTSGTTAAPKGVVHTHAALVRAATDVARTLGLEPADRTWGYLPFFFTGGLVAVALGTLAAGGAVVLQEMFEPGETLALLERERCTVFFAWPHQAEALRAHPRFATTRLALRKGVGANTAWAADLYPPDHHAVGTWGMTETGPLCTAWPWDAPLARRAGSHGPPVAGRELRIVDPETGAEGPPGAEGEICVRGPTLFAGYWRESPAASRDAEGFFHTGDLGRLDPDGALHFLGRLKDVVKVAGANVAAAEVEAVLATHPDVRAVHVVAVPDRARGEVVAAFVVPVGDADAAALVAHCRARLASYKVPRHVWLCADAALPLRPSGKVDKTALRVEAARRVASATDAGDRPPDPPRSPA